MCARYGVTDRSGYFQKPSRTVEEAFLFNPPPSLLAQAYRSPPAPKGAGKN